MSAAKEERMECGHLMAITSRSGDVTEVIQENMI